MGSHSVNGYSNLQKDLYARLAVQEELWKEKAFEDRVALGDKNTNFFFLRTNKKRRGCHIWALRGMDGVRRTGSDYIAQQIVKDWG